MPEATADPTKTEEIFVTPVVFEVYDELDDELDVVLVDLVVF